MSDKKKPFFVTIITGAVMRLQLDDDIYTTEVQTATGLTATEPAIGVIQLPTSIRYALASGLVGIINVVAVKGVEPNIQRRRVGILVELANSDTARAALKNKVIKLGNGAGVNWTIE